MSKYSICHAYAKASYELIQEHKINPEEVLNIFLNLNQISEASADLKNILKDPFVTAAFKIALLYRLCPELEKNEILKKLVCLLAEKKHLVLLLEIAPEFERILNIDSKITEIEVVASNTLSESQLSTLKSTLEKSTGNKIKLKSSIDQSLIAGLVIKTEQYVLDNSVKGRLSKMKRLLVSNN